MTREIKFRAYIKSENRITDVCTIDFYSSFIIDEEWVEYNMSEIVLMQQTGLYDKNNQPIYEWDIVKIKSTTCLVEYKTWMFYCWFVCSTIWWIVKYKNVFDDSIEIIWNIYENPHFIPNS